MKLINALLVAGALAATPVLAQDDEVLKPVVDEAEENKRVSGEIARKD